MIKYKATTFFGQKQHIGVAALMAIYTEDNSTME